MALWHNVALIVFHAISSLYQFLLSASKIIYTSEPKPLHYPRRQHPRHLALALRYLLRDPGSVELEKEELHALLESTRRVAAWSSEIGIETLTVYDREGILKNHTHELESRVGTPIFGALDDSLQQSVALQKTRSGTTRPATHSDPCVPPPFASALSSPSCSVRLHVISSSNGFPAIARAARLIARSHSQHSAVVRGAKQRPSISSIRPLNVTVSQLDEIISADFPTPDFLIVHNLNSAATRVDRSLDGFPPWQLRLTEIHHTTPRQTLSSVFGIQREDYVPIDEWAFRVALDEYALAEMREGK